MSCLAIVFQKLLDHLLLAGEASCQGGQGSPKDRCRLQLMGTCVSWKVCLFQTSVFHKPVLPNSTVGLVTLLILDPLINKSWKTGRVCSCILVFLLRWRIKSDPDMGGAGKLLLPWRKMFWSLKTRLQNATAGKVHIKWREFEWQGYILYNDNCIVKYMWYMLFFFVEKSVEISMVTTISTGESPWWFF